jgi:hypothetical protein
MLEYTAHHHYITHNTLQCPPLDNVTDTIPDETIQCPNNTRLYSTHTLQNVTYPCHNITQQSIAPLRGTYTRPYHTSLHLDVTCTRRYVTEPSFAFTAPDNAALHSTSLNNYNTPFHDTVSCLTATLQYHAIPIPYATVQNLHDTERNSAALNSAFTVQNSSILCFTVTLRHLTILNVTCTRRNDTLPRRCHTSHHKA